VLFALTKDFVWLLIAATVGVISPSGSEIGPFLSIEQAALSQLLPAERRTTVFAWYNLIGSFATAVGALIGGFVCQWVEVRGAIGSDVFRPVVLGYGVFGFVLALMFTGLSSRVEVASAEFVVASVKGPLGLGQSRGIVAKLSVLFALDAFGGGFIVQSVMAYWFKVRFDVDLAMLGGIFFGANILAGISALLAARLANRFGLINTMVFTHLPSNVLLILVPLMPNFPLALTLLLIRYSISQMDVPTRQSYVMAVVDPEERSAAAGVTSMARSLGAALSPWMATRFLGSDNIWLAGMPFYLAGGIKVLYDLLLYREFVTLKTPEEAKNEEDEG
jgi:MFS family permease